MIESQFFLIISDLISISRQIFWVLWAINVMEQPDNVLGRLGMMCAGHYSQSPQMPAADKEEISIM